MTGCHQCQRRQEGKKGVDPFGEEWPLSDVLSSAALVRPVRQFSENAADSLEEHLPKFNSQEFDQETGFYYYNARYYEPEISRFVTADNVIDGEYSTQGWNRYSYCHGNPIYYKDPSGHNILDDLGRWMHSRAATARQPLQNTGESLNRSGTVVNKKITESVIVQSLHKKGAELGNNRQQAIKYCAGAAVLGVTAPIVANAAPGIVASTSLLTTKAYVKVQVGATVAASIVKNSRIFKASSRYVGDKWKTLIDKLSKSPKAIVKNHKNVLEVKYRDSLQYKYKNDIEYRNWVNKWNSSAERIKRTRYSIDEALEKTSISNTYGGVGEIIKEGQWAPSEVFNIFYFNNIKN